jgi:hypothetical protein
MVKPIIARLALLPYSAFLPPFMLAQTKQAAQAMLRRRWHDPRAKVAESGERSVGKGVPSCRLPDFQ